VAAQREPVGRTTELALSQKRKLVKSLRRFDMLQFGTVWINDHIPLD
jgi:hypothetical protein